MFQNGQDKQTSLGKLKAGLNIEEYKRKYIKQANGSNEHNNNDAQADNWKEKLEATWLYSSVYSGQRLESLIKNI